MKGVHQLECPVTLTEKQFRRLRLGHAVQLKPSQIALGVRHKHKVVLHHTTAKKVYRAAMNGKGTRFQMSPQELEMSGYGLREFWDKLKSGAQWLKKNVIDSGIYQQAVKPIVSQAVKTGFAAASPFLGAASPYAEQAVREIGNKTGAYGSGMRRGRGIKNGHVPCEYGHGTGESDVSMTSRQIKSVIPASQYTPLLAPSKYPSVIQYQERIRGTGRGGRGGSFRIN